MKVYNIKSEKQPNGLWRSPTHLYRMEMKGVFLSDELSKLISAMIISFDEIHDISFKCYIGKESLVISHDGNYDLNSRQHIKMVYNEYKLIGNKLYHLVNDSDILLFDRMFKIKKINESIQNK